MPEVAAPECLHDVFLGMAAIDPPISLDPTLQYKQNFKTRLQKNAQPSGVPNAKLSLAVTFALVLLVSKAPDTAPSTSRILSGQEMLLLLALKFRFPPTPKKPCPFTSQAPHYTRLTIRSA